MDPSSASAAGDADLRGAALQDMAEVMDLEFPLEEADWGEHTAGQGQAKSGTSGSTGQVAAVAAPHASMRHAGRTAA